MSELPRLMVDSVTFGVDEEITVSYIRPVEDLKENGLIRNHTLTVPVGGDYDDEIDAVREAIEHLVLDVLDDMPNLPAFTLPDPNDIPGPEQDDDDDE